METIPEKPDILLYIEQMQYSGALMMPGGLMQQPHIFMYEYTLCLNLIRLNESIRQQSMQNNND